ncbi:elongation factor 1-delta-like isoform X2 [Porites lutea]|uniref:elongation factor 1-delta-like isoform X2 n=1 Tax=Porites lutea TaxID=51062 RepID=UPI003CC5A5C2
MSAAMLHESIWYDRPKYEQAEAHYQRSLAGTLSVSQSHGSPVKAPTYASAPASGDARIAQLEEENRQLRKVTDELKNALEKLTLRVTQLEKGGKAQSEPASAPPKEGKKAKDDDKEEDDDDFDLFGSDEEEEDEEEKEERKARLAQYAAKKAKKPGVIAKSNIILDVKPWDDETDLKAMEAAVRSITCDGLLWGSSKFVPVAYGVQKLQISCVVEDDKVGTEFLEEKITEFEDFIQSVDVAAFNKI